jgi:hypothetical protein
MKNSLEVFEIGDRVSRGEVSEILIALIILRTLPLGKISKMEKIGKNLCAISSAALSVRVRSRTRWS